MRHLAEADAVLFGDELARLDARVADGELDAEARVDYQFALDSYESALRVIDNPRSIDSVSEVVDALAAGRYAAACVVARLEGAVRYWASGGLHQPYERGYAPRTGETTLDIRSTHQWHMPPGGDTGGGFVS